tara:strand:- start:18360 stop:19253 length:894 start_codon:yes stop_codon:yes gene_type:complete
MSTKKDVTDSENDENDNRIANIFNKIVFVGIDDSLMQRKIMNKMFTSFECPKYIFGDTYLTENEFIQQIEEIRNEYPDYLIVVIIDQNLNFKMQFNILGTNLSKKIRQNIKNNFITLIRSANDSKKDIQFYNEYADGFLSKTIFSKQALQKLLMKVIYKKIHRTSNIHEINGVTRSNQSNNDDVYGGYGGICSGIDNDIHEEQHQIIIDFFTDTFNKLSEMMENYNLNLKDRWHQLHQIKGDAMSMGFLSLSSKIEKLRNNSSCDIRENMIELKEDFIYLKKFFLEKNKKIKFENEI